MKSQILFQEELNVDIDNMVICVLCIRVFQIMGWKKYLGEGSFFRNPTGKSGI